MGMADILRCLGSAMSDDPRLPAMIERGQELLAAEMRPLHAAIRFPLAIGGDRLSIGPLSIESRDLAKALAGCEGAFLFAATLGAGIDRLIARYEAVDMPMALVLQACAVDAIETYADRTCESLARVCGAEGFALRPRFSPGYGDFSIQHQADILRLLDAGRRIGLSATDAHMLTPLKSITAVIGLSPAPETPSAATAKKYSG